LESGEGRAVWRALYARQRQVVEAHGARSYVHALDRMREVLSGEDVPHLGDLSAWMHAETDWQLVPITDAIPAEEEWTLLARRMVPVPLTLRQRGDLDFVSHRDLFQQVFGLLPHLLRPDFADFLQRLGQIASVTRTDPRANERLQRFGRHAVDNTLVAAFDAFRQAAAPRLFGVRMLSNYRETRCALQRLQEAAALDVHAAFEEPVHSAGEPAKLWVVESWSEVSRDLDCWFKDWQSSQPPNRERS
jgi:phenylalanine-4-hydroxylase